MSVHYTYDESPDLKQLHQGDILQRTDELVELLNKVHPHYVSDEYTHFQVLTQSCDLVIRGKLCKSRYITLAAVRSLDDVIKRTVATLDQKIPVSSSFYCSTHHKADIKQKLKKIFNNNDKELFFLKAERSHNFHQDSCTFLYLSIAIRAYEHYDLCLKSKILQLEDNFQSKLGWMVGNLYSRVGTVDYVPTALATDEIFENHLDEILKEHLVWVPTKKFKDFRKAAKKSSDPNEILNAVEQQTERRRQQTLASIVSTISKSINLDDDQKQKVKNALSNNSVINSLID